MSERPVLVTGYGPYPGVDWNPSLAVVEAMAAQHDRAGLAVRELPVEYDSVDEALRTAVTQTSPCAILMLGLRPSGTAVNLERVALNLDDAPKPDNRGVLRDGQLIEPEGPPAIISKLPLGLWCERFMSLGIPAEVSNHAGAYICNRTYYLAHRLSAKLAPVPDCLFVHLPWIGRPGVNRLDGSPLSVDDLIPPLIQLAAALRA